MKSRFMDVYDDIYAEVVTTSRFDENVPYFRENRYEKRKVIKAEESFPMSEQGFVMGKLMNVRNVKYYWIRSQKVIYV